MLHLLPVIARTLSIPFKQINHYMKASLQRSLPFLFLLALFHGRLLATPTCPIITQSFQGAANGATVDASSTGWYIDASKLTSPTYFAVMSNRFKAENIGAEGIWYSRVFSTAGYASFQAAVKITAEGNQTSSEYVKVYYKVNGGAETLLDQRTGNFGTIDFTSPVLTGSNVQFVVKIYNYANGSSQTSKYYVEQYRVFKETGPCAAGAIGVTASAGNSGVLTCSNPSLTLSASTSASGTTTWSWTGPGSFASTAQNPSVNTAGTYTVVGTNAAGSGSATVTVTSNKTAPDLTATGAALACATSVTINASSSVSGATYSWTGPNSFTSLSRTPSVSTAGTYTVTVTNPANGCTSQQSVTVTAGTVTATTLWLEDFSSLSNGTVSDAGATAWSIANPGTGTFSVQNNEFKASFSSANEGVWSSGVINIAGSNNVVISASLRSETAGSSDFLENNDYIHVYYKLNGGAETLIFEDSAGLGTTTTGTASATALSASLNGNTLQVIIRVRNSDPTERYFFDNVKLVGTNQSAVVTPSVTGTVTCTGTAQLNATVTGGTATAWSWTGPNSFTSSIQNPTVSAGGQYIVTATLSGGCTIASPITVSENKTAPDIIASGGTLACLPTVTLNVNSSVANAAYSWTGPNSFTSAAKNPVVSTVGTYTAKVTNPANGCIATQAVQVSAAAAASIWFEDFSLSNGTVADNGSTIWSVTAPSGSVFSVQGNEFKVSNSTTTNQGVWTSGVIPITGKTNVSISAVVRSSIINNAQMNTDGEFMDYLRFYYKLNGGAEVLFNEKLGIINSHSTTNTPISIGGLSGASLQIIVKARATGSDEFYYFDSVKVMAASTDTINVTASAPGSLTCGNTSVTLSGVSNTPNVSYSWSGPNSFISALQNPSVSAAGVYTLTVTNPSTGCSAADTASVILNNTGISVVASALGVITCNNTTIPLSGSSTPATGVSYAWTGPNSFVSALQNPTVNAGGIYTLTITDPNTGCTGTDTALVTQNKTLPVVTASAVGQFACNNGLISLSGSATPSSGVTYGWTGPNGFTSAVQNPPITVAGIYTLTVTNTATGCVGTDTANAMLNNTAPVASATPSGVLNCKDTIVTLSGSSATASVSYSWTGPNGFTSGVQNPTVKAGGNYILTVTNPVNGCTGTTGVAVNQDTVHPVNVTAVISSANTQLTCLNNNVTLTGNLPGTGFTFLWTSPGVTDMPYTSITVYNPAVYTYTVTKTANFCATSVPVTVVRDNAPPLLSVSPVSPYLTCINPTVNIVASSTTPNVTFAWSGPNGIASATASVTASAGGNYTVMLTNPANGCTNNTTLTAIQNITPPANVLAATQSGSSLITCANSSLVLTGSSSTGSASFAWTGPNGFTASSATASASAAGTYVLTATDPVNGCTASSSIGLQQNTVAPTNVTSTPTPASAMVTCLNPSVALTGGSSTSNVSYSWSGPGGYSNTTNIATATTEGSYVVTVRDNINGCTATATTVVTQNTLSPEGVTANGSNQITCNLPQVNLVGFSTTPGVSYSWTGPNGFTASGAMVPITAGGAYVLKVTNLTNGCFKTLPTTVAQNTTPPANVTAVNSGPLTCAVTEVTLTGNSTSPNVDYEWNGPDGYLSFSAIDVASEPGDYVLTVTNNANGCTLNDTTTVVNTCGARKAVASTTDAAESTTLTTGGNFEYKAYPNPFVDRVVVEFKSPESAFVTVQLFNAIGILEKSLFNDKAVAGQLYRLPFTGRFPAGIHYIVISVNNKVYTKKMISIQ